MKSYWIWNCGDYEIFHTNRVNSRRQQYGMDYPAFWRFYDVDRNVIFLAKVQVPRDGQLILHLNGTGYLKVDGVMYGDEKQVPIRRGEHALEIHVVHLSGLPAAYIESDVAATDGTWYTRSATLEKIPVGWDEKYDKPTDDPETFPFSYETVVPVCTEHTDGGILYDFGKEIFGLLHINGVCAQERIHVSYGESRQEALDTAFAVVQEDVAGQSAYCLRPRAFRYIFLTGTASAQLHAQLEYVPLPNKGFFRCDREDVNQIWQMCAYTLQLNMREVLTEAVKRDRWLWGGDAYQAFKFVPYLCSDSGIVRRSLIGLRGKEPFCEHINTITDYSLLWVMGVLEYYENYGDADFVRFIYPRAVSLMAFCEGREDENGFIVKKYADWIFIDWADMDKTGAVCAEQMLYIAANRAMAKLAQVIGADGESFTQKAKSLTDKVNRFFWCAEKGAFIDSFTSGRKNVTRHANIFAVLYDIADEAQRESIVRNVLKNEDVDKITTPYFEGYELDAMGKLGDVDYIYHMLTTYWKGMLDLGATTVWEAYDPQQSGVEHYAMYGDRYQKSLCHAWGASPIYLLGRYFLGVAQTASGYETFEVRPQRGQFGFVDGAVPVKGGYVRVTLSQKELCVTSTVDGGTLVWQGARYPMEKGKEIRLTF